MLEITPKMLAQTPLGNYPISINNSINPQRPKHHKINLTIDPVHTNIKMINPGD